MCTVCALARKGATAALHKKGYYHRFPISIHRLSHMHRHLWIGIRTKRSHKADYREADEILQLLHLVSKKMEKQIHLLTPKEYSTFVKTIAKMRKENDNE